jgi:hypothetical protein
MQRLPLPFLLMALLVLLATACSGDDASPTTPDTAALDSTTTAIQDATTTTSVAEETPPPSDTTTTSPASTTTTVPSTTTTVSAGPGVLAITRVVFEPATYIAVTNVGSSPVELSDHWLCQRPGYKQLPEFELEAGDTVAIGLGDAAPDDLVGLKATFDLARAVGPVTRDGGELGLYAGPAFDDPASIVDYVEWGSPDHGRSSVAVAAGIWQAGAFVEVPSEALSISSSGAPRAGFEDWFADVGG